jgi:hypothetical protein
LTGRSLIIAAQTIRGATGMRFSWAGLIVARLLVPAVLSAAFGSLQDRSVLAFLIVLVPGCTVSYGTTTFLFQPCLYLLSL